MFLVAFSAAGCSGSSVSELSGVTRLGNSAGDPGVAFTPEEGSSGQRTAAARAATPGLHAELPADVVVSARKSAERASALSNPADKAYRIGPLDVLDISVFNVPELSKSVQVSESGSIGFPLIGDVQAAGRTARDIEANLTAALGSKYLQKPQVTVFIKEYNSQRITIDGAVKRPGVFPVQGSMTLLQALALAQGVSDGSDDTVVVFRTVNGSRSAARFDIGDVRSGTAADPTLVPGDVVVAGKSALKEGFNNLLRLVPAAGLFAIL